MISYNFFYAVTSEAYEQFFYPEAIRRRQSKPLDAALFSAITNGAKDDKDFNNTRFTYEIVMNKNSVQKKLKNKADEILGMIDDFNQFFDDQYNQVIEDTLEEYRDQEENLDLEENDIPRDMLQNNFMQQAG